MTIITYYTVWWIILVFKEIQAFQKSYLIVCVVSLSLFRPYKIASPFLLVPWFANSSVRHVNILRYDDRVEELGKLRNFSVIVGWVYNTHTNESQN